MTWLSTEQKSKLLEFYWESKSVIKTQRKFKLFFRTKAPTRKTILRLTAKFIKTGTVRNQSQGRSGRKRSKRTPQLIQQVKRKIVANPEKSTRRLAQEVHVSQSTIERILRKDLKLFPYKVMKAQELSDTDKDGRMKFVCWAKEKLECDPDFFQSV